MSREFLDRVAAALNARGVRGRSAQRVLAEVADHVDEARRHGDPDPVAAFGDPAVFAREVAAELATAQSRRATFAVFAALALTGVCYALVLGLVPHAGGWRDVTGGHIGAFGPVLAIALVLFPQVAFVAGCLALVGALRIRRARIVPTPSYASFAAAARWPWPRAASTALTVALFALDSSGELAAWWAWTTLALAAVSALPLAVAAGSRPGGPLRIDARGRGRGRLRRPWPGLPLGAGAASRAARAPLAVRAPLRGGGLRARPRRRLVRRGRSGLRASCAASSRPSLCSACFALLGRRLGLRRAVLETERLGMPGLVQEDLVGARHLHAHREPEAQVLDLAANSAPFAVELRHRRRRRRRT